MEIYLALAGIILTAVINIVLITKYLSSIELRVEKTLNEKFSQSLTVLRKELTEKDDTLRHELAETLKPIQTHIGLYEEKHFKLELYIRDNYIEVDTFRNALDDIKALIKEVKDNVTKISEADLQWRKEVRSKG